ncbi:hypothetical protein F5887DRAFT_920347 [Amanita rubescens]|nr:hypothetical protein F5887DRAFT_920347 [Amanita rubescens]
MVKIPIAASLVLLQLSFLFQISFGLPVPPKKHCKRGIDGTGIAACAAVGAAVVYVACDMVAHACFPRTRHRDVENQGIQLHNLNKAVLSLMPYSLTGTGMEPKRHYWDEQTTIYWDKQTTIVYWDYRRAFRPHTFAMGPTVPASQRFSEVGVKLLSVVEL